MQNPISLIRSRLHGRIPKGLAGASLWLALWFCLLFALRRLPGLWGTFFQILQVFVGIAVAAVGIPALWHLVRSRMLWSLRNKLVLTYLLIGLAPAVLFVTLVVIAGYIAAGQFAIHLADSRLQAELTLMSGENRHRADQIAPRLEGQTAPTAVEETDRHEIKKIQEKSGIGETAKHHVAGGKINQFTNERAGRAEQRPADADLRFNPGVARRFLERDERAHERNENRRADFESKPFEVTSGPDCRLHIVDIPGDGVRLNSKSVGAPGDADGNEEAALQVIRGNPTLSLSKVVLKLKEMGIKRSKSWVGNKRFEVLHTGVKSSSTL